MIFNAWTNYEYLIQSNWITTQNLTVEQFHRVELKDDRRSNEVALEIPIDISLPRINVNATGKQNYFFKTINYLSSMSVHLTRIFHMKVFTNSGTISMAIVRKLINRGREEGGGVLIALNDSIMDSFFVLAIGQRVFKKVSEKPAGYLNHIVTFYLVDRWHR